MQGIKENFVSELIRTDITAIKLLGEIILVGIGNYLHIYDRTSKSLLIKNYIFEEQLFGIDSNTTDDKLLLYGANKMKLAKIIKPLDIQHLESCDCNDWILTAKFIDGDSSIVTVSMHNIVTVWNLNLIEMHRVKCEERCILYSAHIISGSWNEIVILSGTVFSQVLIWRPTETVDVLSPVLYRLEGHKGVIFSLDYNQNLGLICSTSDDRTAILWAIKNKDVLKELSDPDFNIEKKSILIGHSARVFKCKFADNFIITAGEDGLVNIWSPEGSLIRKIDTHQDGSVWSLDCDESSNVIITGGEDCGVSWFPLQTEIETNVVKLEHLKSPKRVTVLQSGNLIIITEDGTLLYFNSRNNKIEEISKHDDLNSYSLLEKSRCGKLIALAGYHGNIHIYRDSNVGLEYKFSCQIKNKGRIFSLHWLSCKSFVSCGADGLLILWFVGTDLVPLHFLYLPQSKERWTTCACLCDETHILIGDRRGNLYLYSWNSFRPVQIVKKAHNYLGVTNVYFNDKYVFSLGRNSIVNKYRFDSISGKLILISSDKLSFTWLAALHRFKQSFLLVGFSGNNLIIWDYNARRVLLQTKCGGGHRSWAFTLSETNLHFCYIKDKVVNVLKSNVDNFQTSDVNGYHVNAINSFRSIQIPTSSLEYVTVSGGEDTTLRVSLINSKDGVSKFTNLKVVKSHLSSIRSITTCKLKENDVGLKYLIFSAGGRSQIIMWELDIILANNELIEVVCSNKFSYYKPPNKNESETRVMDLCTVTNDSNIILFAACSDGTIKYFTVDTENENLKFSYRHNFSYKLKCILKICACKIRSREVLLTMATDGYIVIWNLHTLIRLLSTEQFATMQPVSAIKAHQSGINTQSLWKIDEGKCLCLTGGDDNAIALNVLLFDEIDNDLRVEVSATYNNCDAHCAQITGSFINGEYFMTTSIDQKILLFSWFYIDGILEVQLLSRCVTAVCDVHGLECLSSDGEFRIVVYGRGIEVLTVKKSHD